MKMRSVTPMRIAKTGYIVMSAAFCVLGLLFIVRPETSVLAIGRGLGILLILFGTVKLVGYFSKDLFRLAFQYDLEFGILLPALGVIMLIKPAAAMDFILIALGIAVLADGLFKIQIAIDARRFGIRTWWLTFSFAVLTGVIGLVLVIRPWESARLLTILLGIALLAEGVLNLCVAVSTVKIVKHQRPDCVDAEYYRIEDE